MEHKDRTHAAAKAFLITTDGLNPYTFRLDAGGTLTINVTFNTDVECAMSLVDAAHEFGLRYPPFPGCGRFDTVHPRSAALPNMTSNAITFQFDVGYKLVSHNDPTVFVQPWHMCDGQIVPPSSDTLITIGYRNTLVSGSDFTNCVITVSVDKGITPIPKRNP